MYMMTNCQFAQLSRPFCRSSSSCCSSIVVVAKKTTAVQDAEKFAVRICAQIIKFKSSLPYELTAGFMMLSRQYTRRSSVHYTKHT